MLAMRNLVRAEAQLVYLIATLPPQEEEGFIQLMGLPAKQDCFWFRGETTRRNIAYRVLAYQDSTEEEAALTRLVAEKREQYPLPGQIIVYCDTVSKAERYARTLGATCFHRKVGSRQRKAEILSRSRALAP